MSRVNPLMIVGGLFLIAMLASRRAVAASEFMKKEKNFTERDFEKAIKEVAKEYGQEIAQQVERIYRWETAHFKSVQYRRTGSPGMEAALGKDEYPYGWSTPKPLWDRNRRLAPIGLHVMPENTTGIRKRFIIFPSVTAGAFALAEYLKKYRPGRWFSTDLAKQEMYEGKINQIRTRYV